MHPPAPLLSLILSFLTLVSALPPSPSQQNGLTIPLLKRAGHLGKRTEDATKSWASREKAKLMGKYGGPDLVRRGVEVGTKVEGLGKKAGVVKRVDGLISTAGVGGSQTSASSLSGSATSTATSSGATATPTSPVGFVGVSNYEADLEYFAHVGVGVPPQYMNVILDTGSADLWIVSTNCTSLTGCVSLPLLNATASTSAVDIQTSFNVKYGSGSASGEIWQDYVGFGGYNVSSQGFALCDSVSAELLNGNISGLMGMGWQTLAASGLTPFWQNLFQAGVLPFPGFAFSLTRFGNISSAALVEPGGALSIGYLNQSLFVPPVNYVNIPSGLESYWVVPLEGLAITNSSSSGANVTTATTNATATTTTTTTNSTLVGTTNSTIQGGTYNLTGVAGQMAAIDTGTTLIGGPSTVVRSLYARIPGALAATGNYAGYYSFPCATKVNVSFQFGGHIYPMAPDDFNLGPFGTTNNVSTCLGAFFDLSLSSNTRISWVIGAAFLKNVYSVYRASPPSVGFALLSNGSASYNSSSYDDGTYNSSSNSTFFPGGIFGPSGGTSLKMGPTSVGVTTAIQAGQTVSKTPISGAARMARDGWGVMVALGVGVAGIVVLL